MGSLKDQAPENLDGVDKAAPIYGDGFNGARYALDGLSLEDKIVSVLFSTPCEVLPLLRKVNGHSSPGDRHELGEVKDKLCELRDEGKVYHLYGTDRAVTHSKQKSWDTLKWFVESDYVVEKRLETIEEYEKADNSDQDKNQKRLGDS